MNKKIICLFLIILSNSLLLSQECNLIIEKIDGIAYIEKKGATDTLRAFRGSIIEEDSIIRTDSTSMIIVSINVDSKIIGRILLSPASSILLNNMYFSFDNNKMVSISLISGRIEAFVQSSDENNVSIHSATASVFIDKAAFSMQFMESVVTFVALKQGLLSIETDYDNRDINPYDVHISSYFKPSEVKNYKYDNDMNYDLVFSIEEDLMSDDNIAFDKYFIFMKDLSDKHDMLNRYASLSDNEKDINSFISIEVKHHRAIVANEAFFYIIYRTMRESNKNSDEIVEYAKSLLVTYDSNIKLIDKTSNYLKLSRTKIKEPIFVDDVIISD